MFAIISYTDLSASVLPALAAVSAQRTGWVHITREHTWRTRGTRHTTVWVTGCPFVTDTKYEVCKKKRNMRRCSIFPYWTRSQDSGSRQGSLLWVGLSEFSAKVHAPVRPQASQEYMQEETRPLTEARRCGLSPQRGLFVGFFLWGSTAYTQEF